MKFFFVFQTEILRWGRPGGHPQGPGEQRGPLAPAEVWTSGLPAQEPPDDGGDGAVRGVPRAAAPGGVGHVHLALCCPRGSCEGRVEQWRCRYGCTEIPSVTLLQYFVLFFDKIHQKHCRFRKILFFFSRFITTHVYCKQWVKILSRIMLLQNTLLVKILFFSSKILFSALKMLQTFLQGWHPWM